jgi:hypothetical protein
MPVNAEAGRNRRLQEGSMDAIEYLMFMPGMWLGKHMQPTKAALQ